MRSFIRPLDPLSQDANSINFQHPEEELMIMDTLEVWMDYTDILNRKWRIFTRYKWMDGWWKTIEKDKNILKPKLFLHKWRKWRM